jgi:flagellar biosynthesis chaperone FliJ
LFHWNGLFWPVLNAGQGGSSTMGAGMEGKEYLSPPGKLIQFFERSRDGWKKKCQRAKAVVKRSSNGLQALKKSRDRWKALAKQQREELRRLQDELAAQKIRLPQARPR